MNDNKLYKNTRGISLIEVLVAFVILSLAVTVLFRIFSSGSTNVLISQQYVNAVQLAESRLSIAGSVSELESSIEEGTLNDKYFWRTTIQPYYFYEEIDQENYPVSAFQIVVDISWQNRGQTRSIQLSNIKIQQNKSPIHSG